MNPFNSLLEYLRLSVTATSFYQNAITKDIIHASYRHTDVLFSAKCQSRRLDPRGKLVVKEFLDALEKDTPNGILHTWVRVRMAGVEDKVYTPELLSTLTRLWKRWSDEKEVKKEFAFLCVDGVWLLMLRNDVFYKVPLDPIVEGMERWLEQRRTGE